jgi:hypothetical protein
MRRGLIALASVPLMLSLAGGASGGQRPNHETKRRAPYFVGNFNTCDFSQWRTQGPAASFKIVHAPKTEGACAAALTVGPWASPGLGEQRADGAAIYLAPAPYGTVGKTVWQHFSVQFAPGFRATTGAWNWFVEWHNDPSSETEFANLCWTVRKTNGSERIAMRILGGPSTAPRTIWVNGPRLRTGIWYDFRVRTVWSPDPKKGFVQWWLSGRRLYSRHAATLYTHPDGSVNSVYFILDNYRLHADWNSTIFFDGTRLGPTRSSVHY